MFMGLFNCDVKSVVRLCDVVKSVRLRLRDKVSRGKLIAEFTL